MTDFFNLDPPPVSCRSRPAVRRDSPALRLADTSADYLSDPELLSLLLRKSSRLPDPLVLAHSLLNRYGSLTALAGTDPRELQQIDGLGPVNAAALHGAFALAVRLSREKLTEGAEMNSPRTVAEYMMEECRPLKTEKFQVLLLNVRNRLIGRQTVVSGLVDRAPIHPREVFRPAIAAGCSRILLVHNHPSGDPSPSFQDIESTGTLVEAGKIVGIEVLDHVIIGACTGLRNKGWFSMKEDNMIQGGKKQ